MYYNIRISLIEEIFVYMLQNSANKALLSQNLKINDNIASKVDLKSDEIVNTDIKQSEVKTSKLKKQKKESREKQFTFVLKIFNFLIAIMLIAFGVYCYYDIRQNTDKSFKLMEYIMPAYIACSGLIILAIEMHIKFICRNMKFLYNYFGRGLFNIYIGVMPLTLLDTAQNSQQTEIQQVFIYILVCLLLFIGVLYIFSKIFCCAKEDDKKKKKRNNNQSDSQSN